MKHLLTERQSEILARLRDYIREHGYAPTVRELCNLIGVSSPNGIQCHLNALRTKGYVTWINGKSRTLRLLPHRER